MSTISSRVSDKDLKLFKFYAQINNKSLSGVIRDTMIYRVEYTSKARKSLKKLLRVI
ncbi:DUF6290 family protein [Eubacteriales bacterium KG127]